MLDRIDLTCPGDYIIGEWDLGGLLEECSVETEAWRSQCQAWVQAYREDSHAARCRELRAGTKNAGIHWPRFLMPVRNIWLRNLLRL